MVVGATVKAVVNDTGRTGQLRKSYLCRVYIVDGAL